MNNLDATLQDQMRQIIDSLIPHMWKILIGAWVLNVITTWYYGWTMTPSCRNEEIWDVICAFLFMLAIVLFIIDAGDNCKTKKEQNGK